MVSYFDREASTYSQRSSRGLWRKFRDREYSVLRELLGLKPGLRILDLGCGSGYHLTRLRAECPLELTAVDASAAMLDAISAPDVRKVLARAESLPNLGAFDRVLAAGVFEFVNDLDGALAGAARSLTPEGAMVMLVPRDGLAGLFYQHWHEWRGCETHIRSTSDYTRAANRFGLHLTHARVATSISVALKFVRAF